MRVIIDGDAAFVAADDFVNLQESEVAWIDVPAATLADFRRRDRNLSLREAANHIDGLLVEAERICLEHSDEDLTSALSECQMTMHQARDMLGI